MSHPTSKRTFRQLAVNTRNTLAKNVDRDCAGKLADRVLGLLSGFQSVTSVSVFLSIEEEIDTGPCLSALSAAGYETCLPVVVAKEAPLVFRSWRDGQDLEAGPLNTRQPKPEASEVTPSVLLVPLLAFDLAGNRIGWGGGYYDRTLQALRAADRDVLAVGICYDGQCVDAVPVESHDERLDWVVTEGRTINTNTRKDRS